MTRTEKGPGPPQPRAEISSHNATESPGQGSSVGKSSEVSAPTVVGVVEVALADLDHFGSGVPVGGTVRVRLPDEFGLWGTQTVLSLADLGRLAAGTWCAGRVEIVGADHRAVADAVETVRRRHAEYRLAEAAEGGDEPTWPAPTKLAIGTPFTELQTRRAEAVTPARCRQPGCNRVVSVKHPLPPIEDVRCGRHAIPAEPPA